MRHDPRTHARGHHAEGSGGGRHHDQPGPADLPAFPDAEDAGETAKPRRGAPSWITPVVVIVGLLVLILLIVFLHASGLMGRGLHAGGMH